MKLRGRDLFIVAGVVAAVVCAGWYFLLFSPLRTKSATLDTEVAAKDAQLQQAHANVQRLLALKKTAPQAQADLVRYKKMLPAELGQPGFIVELTQTAKASGLDWTSVTPDVPVLATPFSVMPIELLFNGKYFDLVDFLYRLENYVDYRNQNFLVTGRLYAVSYIEIVLNDESLQNGNSPVLAINMTVHGFMWTPEGTVPGVEGEGQ